MKKTKVGKNSTLKERKQEYNRRYKQSLKGKKSNQRYNFSAKGQETARKHNQSNEAKVARKKYKKSLKGKIVNKKYRQSTKGKKAQKKYEKSLKGKTCDRKYQAIRRRFGFKPLNKPFVGCEGHHIDFERVIYIPQEIHRSVWHSLVSGVGMDKINKLAFDYLKIEIESNSN